MIYYILSLSLSLSLMDHEIVLSMGISITTSGFLNWDPGSSQLYTCFFFSVWPAAERQLGELSWLSQGGVLVAYQDGELLRGRRRLLQKLSSFFVVIFTTAGSQKPVIGRVVLV